MYLPLQTQILSEKFTQSFSLSISTDRGKVELMVELCNRPFFICPSSQNAKSLAKKFKYSPIWTISDICLHRNKKPTTYSSRSSQRNCEKLGQQIEKKCTFVCTDVGSVALLLHNTLKCSAILGLSFIVWCWWPRESVLWGSSTLSEFCTSLSKVLTL